MEICVSAEKCGGCRYQGVEYEAQLKEKYDMVKGLVEGAGFDVVLLQDIQPCPERVRYRNRMDYTFGNEYIDGPLQLGLHERRRFMSVIYSGNCLIVPEDFNRLLDATLEFCRGKGYDFYHRRRHEGLLRCLIVRRGVRTGQLLVNIVTSCGEFDEGGYIKKIMSTPLDNEVCGIIRTVDYGRSDAVSPDEVRTLYGVPYYMEKVLDLDFKVGAFSFFQTNVTAAERLYRDAIALIDDIEGKTVFDLYCGTGTISQAMATRAGKVYGVEIVEESVNAARENALLNGLTNCEFICGDVLTTLEKLPKRPDVIVVDPPRAGIHPKAMASICAYGVEQIVYISCNPKSLVENLKQAREYGYEPKLIRPYDNFAFTGHVETVVLMSRVER